jgi:hypothetical protein
MTLQERLDFPKNLFGIKLHVLERRPNKQQQHNFWNFLYPKNLTLRNTHYLGFEIYFSEQMQDQLNARVPMKKIVHLRRSLKTENKKTKKGTS